MGTANNVGAGGSVSRSSVNTPDDTHRSLITNTNQLFQCSMANLSPALLDTMEGHINTIRDNLAALRPSAT